MSEDARGVKLRHELAAMVRAMGLVLRYAPLASIGLLVMVPVSGLVHPFLAGMVGRAIGLLPRVAFSDVAAKQLTQTALLIGAGFLLANTADALNDALRFRAEQRFKRAFVERLMESVLDLPGLAHFEDPEARDKLQVANWAASGPGQMLGHVVREGATLVSIFGYLALTTAIGWWLPVGMVVAAIPGGIASLLYGRAEGMAQWSNRLPSRWNRYYSFLGVDPRAAKEARVFGFAEWILDRHHASWLDAIVDSWRIRRRRLLVGTGLVSLPLAVTAAGYLALVLAATRGQISVGTFASASIALIALLGSIPMLLGNLTYLRDSVQFLPDALRVMKLPHADPRLYLSEHPVTPSGPASGIRFEGVSFTYPRTDRPILSDLNLFVPAGKTVALVGENGAGKTTLIKLLCRFYDPDQGRILLDGIDIKKLDLAELRRRLSVIFQDFQRYPFSARDNIGFGSPAHLGDTALLETAAERTGTLQKIRELPDGWETALSRQFGGVDLSGGEWQRVALSRAMMARLGSSADILILDEPTANLDVRVEHELYQRFAEITQGATTFLVSHRFSTVRMAELMVVLAGGRIVEQGSHDELLALGGKYAELYLAQAAHFREDAK